MTKLAWDWIQTYTGKKFYPGMPTEDTIDIVDIAHALANTCRYAGHCKEFYSVAQHCVLASYVVNHPHQLEALLHDASEAYINDIPSPAKAILPDYKVMEKNIMDVVYEKYGIVSNKEEVKRADLWMLSIEARQLLPMVHPEWNLPDTGGMYFDITPWTPKVAEEMFLKAFKVYTSGDVTQSGLFDFLLEIRKSA